MFKIFTDRTRGLERNFLLFLAVGIFLGLGQSIDGSTINNFLKERFHIVIMQRSLLEMPRELPGFLVFLIVGFLYSLGDIRLAVAANLCAAVGMFLLGVIPSNYFLLVICMFVYSTGIHVYMPLTNSIGMSFANEGRLGRKLGQINAANTAALVFGSAVLWIVFKYLHLSYSVMFIIGSVTFIIASVLLMLMNPGQTVKMKNRFIFRKEYRLFYWLSVLYGARKQIFLTFGPWVLVDIFKQKVTTMTVLFFVISVTSIFVKPLTGYLIDRVGERFVLGGEAAILFFVCIGYAFAENIIPGNGAVIIACICYILDQTLSSAGMARATYIRKIAVEQEDVSPALSTGISIDHIMSMFIPTLGGFVWYSSGAGGYKYVFFGGAFIALVNFISTRMIKITGKSVENVPDTGIKQDAF